MALRQYALILLTGIYLGCQNADKEEPDVVPAIAAAGVSEPEVTTVTVHSVKPQNFAKEIISQGIVEARYVSEVTFDLSERIEEVLVETGQQVSKGQVLARLRDYELQHQLQKIDHQIEQAKVQLEARLIALGYTTADSTEIPPAILKTARLENNLNGLELERALALYQLEQTEVRAPIAGVVAEVEAQAGNPTSAYQKLCTIIDNQRLEAVFPVLEQELALVKKGQSVTIRPLHRNGKSFNARISAVMPRVDEHGMVKVFARLAGSGNELLDGMHVTAVIRDEVAGQLVVPKSAVVDRQGRQVVFVHRDGQAHWQYVEIGLENSDAYTIVDGLKAGDEVIIDNNFHLSHLEKVAVAKSVDQDAEPL